MKKGTLFLALTAVSLLACPIATAPPPEPTATWTPIPPFPTGTPTARPTMTSTPVVIIVTATPAPTPATPVDMDDLYQLPPIEILAIPLIMKYDGDVTIADVIGIPGDGKVCLQFEHPRGSGQWYVAVIEPGGGYWPLLGVIPVEPTPALTPGAGREARVNVSFPSGDALDGAALKQSLQDRF